MGHLNKVYSMCRIHWYYKLMWSLCAGLGNLFDPWGHETNSNTLYEAKIVWLTIWKWGCFCLCSWKAHVLEMWNVHLTVEVQTGSCTPVIKFKRITILLHWRHMGNTSFLLGNSIQVSFRVLNTTSELGVLQLAGHQFLQSSAENKTFI